MDSDGICLDEERPVIRLRGRQPEWIEAIERDLKTKSRLLVVAPGGVGKTTVFAYLAHLMWQRGIRTLVLENRDRLTEQTANRIRKETGLEVDIEKGDQRAALHCPVVVGCVQSISKVARLTGFPVGHFGLVVADECHLALSPSWLRVINYFHYGAESLAPEWVKPEQYKPHCALVGFTASPDIGNSRNLGELFQGPKPTVNYTYLEAIEEGWLVGIKEVNIPVKIDTRKFRIKRSQEGDSFSVADQNAAMIPVIHELAEQLVEHAADRKTMCFVPSVEIARLMADALNGMGLNAIFISGECIDKNEKTDKFAAAGPGSVCVNCCLFTYGVDFPDIDCVAPFGAMISKAKYVQSIYRGTRVLDGTVRDSMTAEERVAAIAASKKPYLLVLSPFFISDRINICEPFDLFGTKPDGKKPKKAPDLTKPAEIRDYIAALENLADKHKHRQPRTIDPVRFSLSVGAERIAAYQPETAAESMPATKDELDVLLKAGLDTSQIKTSGQAQKLISTLRERQRLGLVTPKQLQMLLNLGIPEHMASTMKSRQAGAILGRKQEEWKRDKAVRVLTDYARTVFDAAVVASTDWGALHDKWPMAKPAEVVKAARLLGLLPE